MQAIYTLGTVSSYTSPVTVQATIKTLGTSATTTRTATLTVSSATTFTSTRPVPTIAVGATAMITFPSYPVAATMGTNTIIITLPANEVAVTPTPVTGDFFIPVRQLSTTNIGLVYQTESPLQLASFYASNDGTNFIDLSVAGVTFRPVIAVTLTNPLATRNDARAATVSPYPNPAHQNFTLTLPAGSLTAASTSLLNALG